MARLAAFGLAADPPSGWDGEVYRRDPQLPDGVSALFGAAEVTMPILHLANFPLPSVRGDYGGGAVELMGRGGVFISLLEHPPEEGRTAMFSEDGIPWPMSGGDFDPQQMQRTIGGQAGCQRFFTHEGRAFCLYVAIGNYTTRAVLVREVNRALATVDLG
jgi:hypothetical protein